MRDTNGNIESEVSIFNRVGIPPASPEKAGIIAARSQMWGLVRAARATIIRIFPCAFGGRIGLLAQVPDDLPESGSYGLWIWPGRSAILMDAMSRRLRRRCQHRTWMLASFLPGRSCSWQCVGEAGLFFLERSRSMGYHDGIWPDTFAPDEKAIQYLGLVALI